MKREELLIEIQKYSQLNDSWKGENSLAPTPYAIKQAYKIINLIPDFVLSPTPIISYTGSIGFYWSTENLLAELEIIDNNKVNIHFFDKITMANEYKSDELVEDFFSHPLVVECLRKI